MTDPHIAAAGLTKAQKRALLDAEDMTSNHGGYPFLTVRLTSEPWPMGLAEFLTLKTDRLTSLGLAVRAILQEQTP